MGHQDNGMLGHWDTRTLGLPGHWDTRTMVRKIVRIIFIRSTKEASAASHIFGDAGQEFHGVYQDLKFFKPNLAFPGHNKIDGSS